MTLAEHVRAETFVLRNLKPGAVYLFMIRAVNTYGLSDPSPISDSVRTQGQCHTSSYFLSFTLYRHLLILVHNMLLLYHSFFFFVALVHRQHCYYKGGGPSSHPERTRRRRNPPAHAHSSVGICCQTAVDGEVCLWTLLNLSHGSQIHI